MSSPQILLPREPDLGASGQESCKAIRLRGIRLTGELFHLKIVCFSVAQHRDDHQPTLESVTKRSPIYSETALWPNVCSAASTSGKTCLINRNYCPLTLPQSRIKKRNCAELIALAVCDTSIFPARNSHHRMEESLNYSSATKHL